MKVSEIKAKQPLAVVYEFRPDCRYLILLKETPLEEAYSDAEQAEMDIGMVDALTELVEPCRCLVFYVRDTSDIRILEVAE
jgi:hypothetical protein